MVSVNLSWDSAVLGVVGTHCILGVFFRGGFVWYIKTPAKMSQVNVVAVEEILEHLGTPRVDQWVDLALGIVDLMGYVNAQLMPGHGLINFWMPPPELKISNQELADPGLMPRILGTSLGIGDFYRTGNGLFLYAVASNLSMMNSLPVLYWYHAALITARNVGAPHVEFNQHQLNAIDQVRINMRQALWSTAHETDMTLSSIIPRPTVQIYNAEGQIMPAIQFINRNSETIKIQSLVRMFLARDILPNARRAVTKIQNTVRMHQARNTLSKVRSAIIKTQSLLRMFLARKAAEYRRSTITKIQSLVRMRKVRMRGILPRVRCAVTKIQRAVRTHQARASLTKRSVTKIQNLVRAFLARRTPPSPSAEPRPSAASISSTPPPSSTGGTADPKPVAGPTPSSKSRKRKSRKRKSRKAKAPPPVEEDEDEEDIEAILDDLDKALNAKQPIDAKQPIPIPRLDPEAERQIYLQIMAPQIQRSLDLLEHPGIELGLSVPQAVAFIHALIQAVPLNDPLYIRVHPFTTELMKQLGGMCDRSIVVNYRAATIALKIFALAMPSYEVMADVFAARVAAQSILRSLQFFSGETDIYSDVAMEKKWTEGHHVLMPIICAINSLPLSKRETHIPVLLSDMKHPNGKLVPMIANCKTAMVKRYLQNVAETVKHYADITKENLVPLTIMAGFRGTDITHKSRSLEMLMENESLAIGHPTVLRRDFNIRRHSSSKSALAGRIVCVTLLLDPKTDKLVRDWYGCFNDAKANRFMDGELDTMVQLPKMLTPVTLQSRPLVVQALGKRLLPKTPQYNLGSLDSHSAAAGFSVAVPVKPFLSEAIDVVLAGAAEASASIMREEALYASRIVFGTIGIASYSPLSLMLRVITNIMGTAIITASDAPYGPNLIAASDCPRPNRMAMLNGHMSFCPFDQETVEDALFIGITDSFAPDNGSKHPGAVMASNSLPLLHEIARTHCKGRMMVLCTLLGDSEKLKELGSYAKSCITLG